MSEEQLKAQEEWEKLQRRIYKKVDSFLKHLNQIERDVISGKSTVLKQRLNEINETYRDEMEKITEERDRELELINMTLNANMHANQCDLQDEIETEREDMLEELEEEREKIVYRQLIGFCSRDSVAYNLASQDELSAEYSRMIHQQRKQRQDIIADSAMEPEYKFTYMDVGAPVMTLSEKEIEEDLKSVQTEDTQIGKSVIVDSSNLIVGGIRFKIGQMIKCSFLQYCSFQGVIESMDSSLIVLRLPRKCHKIPVTYLRNGVVRFSFSKTEKKGGSSVVKKYVN